jgi:very-short-patch-repair endonuclease
VPTWRQRVVGATLVRSSIAIGVTAAALHGIDGVDSTAVVVAVPRGGRNQLADQCVQVLHSYSADDVVVVDGIRCSGLARTMCDLAWQAPHLLGRALDDFQRRRCSLEWLAHTVGRVELEHVHGCARLRRELERRQVGGVVTDSWFERLVERVLQQTGIGPIVRQFEVFDDRGEFVARVDLAVPHLRLAIEAHSRQFHTGPQRETFDQRRDNRLAAVGWETIYVGWEDASSATVAAQIRRIAERRAVDLGISSNPAGQSSRSA